MSETRFSALLEEDAARAFARTAHYEFFEKRTGVA